MCAPANLSFYTILKGYIRFVGKYVTGRRKRFRLHKVYRENYDVLKLSICILNLSKKILEKTHLEKSCTHFKKKNLN